MNDYNDNPIANKWKQRYDSCSPEIQHQLDVLYNASSMEYQFKTIKKTRKPSHKGEMFIVNPIDDETYYGIVLNDAVDNINGDDLYVIAILKEKIEKGNEYEINLTPNDLLVDPCIVGKEYWTKGLFGKTDIKVNVNLMFSYGFYYIGKNKYVDEYGTEILEKPDVIESFGIATITGIAYKVRKELIIHKGMKD